MGSDHADRRQPRHPHRDRLHQPAGLKCYSTSMIFRGFDIFMKGIDPRDAHFITSRICGICGDNHCTCSCLNQNMAYRRQAAAARRPRVQPGGDRRLHVRPRDLQRLHGQRRLLRADGQGRPTRRCWRRPRTPRRPRQDIHGYKTIADIMRALNPFTGSFYLETLQVARYTREMYCLFGGRHTHPSTIMPGGCSADITHQTLHRLLRAPDALLRLRQAQRADARRPVRLLPAASCPATTWSATATPTSSTGAPSTTPTTSTTTTAT